MKHGKGEVVHVMLEDGENDGIGESDAYMWLKNPRGMWVAYEFTLNGWETMGDEAADKLRQKVEPIWETEVLKWN